MKYVLEKKLRKTCKHCKKKFLAARTSVFFCSKKCNADHKYAYNLKMKKWREKAKANNHKRILQEKKNTDILWSDSDTLSDYQAVADYLNIGKEEVLKKWTTIPKSYAPHTKKTKIGYQTCNKVYFSKKKIDAWAEDIEFWKLKEPHVKNYKEPLKKVPEGQGYGYLGAVTVTASGDGIQCHICGKFFEHLSGHLLHAHKIKTIEYKEQFQIAYTTPLTSDNYREVLKIKELERLKNMTEAERIEFRQCGIRAMYKKKTHFSGQTHLLTLESRNKRGTCPDQLIDQIRQCQKVLGKTPSKKEFIAWSGTQRYVHLIYKIFGSYKKALEIAGFIGERSPSRLIKGQKLHRWEDEELIEYLRIFYQETKKIPTQTDWYSHDLPDYSIYIKKFGSISKAREAADIPNPIIGKRAPIITRPDMIPMKTLTTLTKEHTSIS